MPYSDAETVKALLPACNEGGRLTVYRSAVSVSVFPLAHVNVTERYVKRLSGEVLVNSFGNSPTAAAIFSTAIGVIHTDFVFEEYLSLSVGINTAW